MKTVISTTDAPGAIGPYNQAIRSGNMLFVSGQIPLDPATGQVVPGDVADQALQCCKNIRAILNAAGYTMEHIVKSTVFIVDMADFAQVNEVYKQHFAEPYPARSCVAVRGLPLGVRVEIEVIAAS